MTDYDQFSAEANAELDAATAAARRKIRKDVFATLLFFGLAYVVVALAVCTGILAAQSIDRHVLHPDEYPVEAVEPEAGE